MASPVALACWFDDRTSHRQVLSSVTQDWVHADVGVCHTGGLPLRAQTLAGIDLRQNCRYWCASERPARTACICGGNNG
jgi:hypothetical protein